jgi:hypothetical protein
MNLFVYWEYAKWICSYTENMRNGSVCIRRIHGINEKLNITENLKPKSKKFRMFIRSLDGFVWPNHIKLKIFCKYTCKLPIRKSNLGLLSDRQRFLSTRMICPQYWEMQINIAHTHLYCFLSSLDLAGQSLSVYCTVLYCLRELMSLTV